jgi:uncharacterized protein
MNATRRSWIAITLLLAALFWAPSSFAQAPKNEALYRRSIEQWKTELIAGRKKNWLTLVGLFWLKPGENAFGADDSNNIVLPKNSAAAHAGFFELSGNDVQVKFLKGVKASVDGKLVPATASLRSDQTGNPSIIAMGSLRMYVIRRGQRIGVRAKDMNSPAARNYPGAAFYPVDLRYRVTATFVPANARQTVDVPNVLGDLTATPVAGTVVFKINGHDEQLTDLGGDPTKGLFFVFTDRNRKTETYPGGRFLDTDAVVDGKVVLDFNQAYNPPCSVTPYATCPLAPKENRLAIAIPAGEKYDRGRGQH